jgi:hypothetical protein
LKIRVTLWVPRDTLAGSDADSPQAESSGAKRLLRDLCPAEWSKAMNRNFTKSESTLSTVPIPRNTFEPFVSADAVACYVGIERRQVMQLTRAGKLPAYPLDPEAKRKAWRYKLSEVDATISGKS